MIDQPQPRIAPEVLTAAVWDAIKDVPGIVDLHRNPLQQLGEKVKLDWHGPVRLSDEDGETTLEVHIVAAAGRPLQPVAEAARHALQQYAERALAMPAVHVRVCIDDIAEAPPASSD
jgi:uncharacterized alkaline shock family protein YloU